MLTESSRQGLVVSASPLAPPALKELIICCGWPVLLQATPRRFHSEMLLGVPKLSLFWLDDDQFVGTTVELLSWLGMYQPTVRRVAVGYQVPASVEVAVRSAGAHLYLAADGNIRALLEGSIAPWLPNRNRLAAGTNGRSFAAPSQDWLQQSLGITLPAKGPP